jgi:hypothetical protein
MKALNNAKRWSTEKTQEVGWSLGVGLSHHLGARHGNTVTILRDRALQQSAEFFEPLAGRLTLFDEHRDLHTWIASQVIPGLEDGLFIEFGYYNGDSASRLAPSANARSSRPTYYAFDAFQGLRDAWSSVGASNGAFDLHGHIPAAPPGVDLVTGWVEDTLDDWLESHAGRVAFCHFDLDVYPPTRYAIERIRPRLTPGSVILFDELHGYPGWREHEFRALNEVLDPSEYEFVALGPEQALIRMLNT